MTCDVSSFLEDQGKAKMKFFFNSSQLLIKRNCTTHTKLSRKRYVLLANQNQTNTYRGGLRALFRVTRQLQVNIQTRL